VPGHGVARVICVSETIDAITCRLVVVSVMNMPASAFASHAVPTPVMVVEPLVTVIVPVE
jgi:hypothetical protein